MIFNQLKLNRKLTMGRNRRLCLMCMRYMPTYWNVKTFWLYRITVSFIRPIDVIFVLDLLISIAQSSNIVYMIWSHNARSHHLTKTHIDTWWMRTRRRLMCTRDTYKLFLFAVRTHKVYVWLECVRVRSVAVDSDAYKLSIRKLCQRVNKLYEGDKNNGVRQTYVCICCLCVFSYIRFMKSEEQKHTCVIENFTRSHRIDVCIFIDALPTRSNDKRLWWGFSSPKQAVICVWNECRCESDCAVISFGRRKSIDFIINLKYDLFNNNI